MGLARLEKDAQHVGGRLRRTDAGAERDQPAEGTGSGGVADRVEHAIEHEGADLAGKEVGVGVAQVGAVGVAGVGELRVADGPPEQIHVARHVGGRARERGVLGLCSLHRGRGRSWPSDSRAPRRNPPGTRGARRRTPAAHRRWRSSGSACWHRPLGDRSRSRRSEPCTSSGSTPRMSSRTKDTGEFPGPPLFTNREPMRRLGSVAGWRMRANEIVGPPGGRSRAVPGRWCTRSRRHTGSTTARGPRRVAGDDCAPAGLAASSEAPMATTSRAAS